MHTHEQPRIRAKINARSRITPDVSQGGFGVRWAPLEGLAHSHHLHSTLHLLVPSAAHRRSTHVHVKHGVSKRILLFATEEVVVCSVEKRILLENRENLVSLIKLVLAVEKQGAQLPVMPGSHLRAHERSTTQDIPGANGGGGALFGKQGLGVHGGEAVQHITAHHIAAQHSSSPSHARTRTKQRKPGWKKHTTACVSLVGVDSKECRHLQATRPYAFSPCQQHSTAQHTSLLTAGTRAMGQTQGKMSKPPKIPKKGMIQATTQSCLAFSLSGPQNNRPQEVSPARRACRVVAWPSRAARRRPCWQNH